MINNNLKYAREEIEMTQKELGEKLGVHETTISNWENGYDSIPILMLWKFCKLYNYSLNYMLGLDKVNEGFDGYIIDKNIISNNLKNMRLNLRLTQKEMAEILEISQPRYCNYETGKVLPSTFIIYVIGLKFKIKVDKLFII